jgi:hypothetical protein
VYRATNLIPIWLLFAVVMLMAVRFADLKPEAAAWCMALLLSDVSLVVLGITDLGRFIGLGLGFWLLFLFHSSLERPAWWKFPIIALVVFLGEWDRINFIWFVLAGTAGVVVAAIVRPSRRAWGGVLVAVAASVAGLALIDRLIPDYRRAVMAGAGKSWSVLDPSHVRNHFFLLFGELDPFGAYHRYVNVRWPGSAGLYAMYRWTFAILYVGATLTLGALAIAARRDDARRARAFAFLATVMAALPVLILGTGDSWAVHHVLPVKPIAYVALASLATLGASRPGARRPVTAAGVLVVAGAAFVGVVGFLERHNAPAIRGVYDVSRNADEAWAAAAATDARTIYALDWGVFYPGIVNSPSDQRWEMRELRDSSRLRTLDAARRGEDFGLLLRMQGPHRWLIDSEAVRSGLTVIHEQHFTRQEGEPWALLLVSTARWRELARPVSPDAAANILTNGDFADDAYRWQYTKWEEVPGGAELGILPCDAPGAHRCVRLAHRAPADSLIFQSVSLEPRVIYEVSTWARAEGVGSAAKGVHLCLFEPLVVESEELTGDTPWRRLRFYVVNLGTAPRAVHVAARLGTFGSVATGHAWFSSLAVRPVSEPERGEAVYELGASS